MYCVFEVFVFLDGCLATFTREAFSASRFEEDVSVKQKKHPESGKGPMGNWGYNHYKWSYKL